MVQIFHFFSYFRIQVLFVVFVVVGGVDDVSTFLAPWHHLYIHLYIHFGSSRREGDQGETSTCNLTCIQKSMLIDGLGR